jgi:TRAP-type C4-dicarboxylate transport system permease small subunit
MVMINAIHKLSDRLDKLCGLLCIICLSLMVIITGLQIVCRVYFTALIWSEELTRYLLVWSTFLGASCVYKRAGHINVTLVQNLFPAGGRQILRLSTHIVCGAFFLLAAYLGVRYMNFQSRQLSAAMRIPMSWIYLAIPVGCGLMALHVADAILRMFPAAGKEDGK